MVKDDQELRKKVELYQEEVQMLINESHQARHKYERRISKRTLEINDAIVHELNSKALLAQNTCLNERINQMQRLLLDYEQKEFEYKKEIEKLKKYSNYAIDPPMSPVAEIKSEAEGENEMLLEQMKVNSEVFAIKLKELEAFQKKEIQEILRQKRKKHEVVKKSLESRCARLELKNGKLIEQLATLEDLIAENAKKISSFDEEVDRLKSDHEYVLNEKKSQHDEEIKKLSEDSAEQETKLREMLEHERQALAKQLSEQVVSSKRIEALKETFKSEKVLVIKSFKKKCDFFAKEIHTKQERVTALEEKLKRTKAKVNRVEGVNELLKTELIEKVKKAKKEHDAELCKLEQKIALLQKELGEKDAKHESDLEITRGEICYLIGRGVGWIYDELKMNS